MNKITVCIISDTHGHIDPRILALANNSDYVLHAGDIGNAAVLNALKPRCEVYAVRGNNDVAFKWREGDYDTLQSLELNQRIQFSGGVIALEHGHRVNPVATRHDRLRRSYPDARAIVYGHSHIMLVDDSALPWVLNPGAAGRERTKGGPSCLLLDMAGDDWQVQEIRFARETHEHRF